MNKSLLIISLFLMLTSCNEKITNDIVISTKVELNTAIKNAKPGDVIILKDGTYSNLEILFVGEGTKKSIDLDKYDRYYYHMFVVLDVETFNVKRYSIPFTFEKKHIELAIEKSPNNIEVRFVRLSIQDLSSKGNQPFLSLSKKYLLILINIFLIMLNFQLFHCGLQIHYLMNVGEHLHC